VALGVVEQLVQFALHFVVVVVILVGDVSELVYVHCLVAASLLTLFQLLLYLLDFRLQKGLPLLFPLQQFGQPGQALV
jgi:hypothetical protein